MIVTTHQAKSQLSKLIAAALAGEEIVIARGSEPLVRLTPVQAPPTKTRTPGRLKGAVGFDEAYFDPLPEDELELWNGKSA
jgi:antitoxin (DNA-binding transcriptional repressor) of toxin-antitoxin stability system